ncbi:MAG: hypothetical protein NTX79_05680 [Candidatus Micrarchaeota archaeon]|nr:hypothetical protein [Candidatus Micrarchaeota archaeon]
MRLSVILFAVAMLVSAACASTYNVAPMTYTALSADTYRVATQQGDVACGATASQDWMYQSAKLIEMKSTTPIFGGPGDVLSGDYYFAKVLFDPIGLTGTGSTSLNGTYFQSTNTAQWAPRVFWKLPGRDCYNWNNIAYGDTGIGNAIKLDIAGQNAAAQGSIYFTTTAQNPTLADANVNIALKEDAGKSGTISNTAVSALVPVIANNTGISTHRFKKNDAATSAVYYIGTAQGAPLSYEPVFVTERGSRWLSIGTTDVSAQIATKLAKPSFVFRTSALPVNSTTWPQYVFETLITDTVDKTPQNRQNTLPEDEYPSQLSDIDTGGAITSPLRGSYYQGSVLAKNLYRIGAAEYAPFADYAVVDNLASNGTYVEKQAYWVGSTPSGVAYDAGAKDVIVNKYSAMVHSAKFEGNDFGVPVCTDDLNPTMPGDWTSCMNSSGGSSGYVALSDRHRVGIRFLNKNWIISEMQWPSAPLASGTAAINGGEIKLAKEQTYGIINAGTTLPATPFSIRLNDVSVVPCFDGEFPAILDILDSGNTMIGQIMQCPGTTYTFTQSGTGNSIKVHVYQTHPGFTLMEKWAELSVYDDEITLKDGSRYNLVSSQDPDKDFRVTLLWKNRDYASGSSTVADSLREIAVYDADNFGKTYRMQTFNFLNSQPAFRVTYGGITPIQPGPVPMPVPATIGNAGNKEDPASIAKVTTEATQEPASVDTKQVPKPIARSGAKAKPKAQASWAAVQKETVAEKTLNGNARTENGATPAAAQVQPKPKEMPAPVKESVRNAAPEKSEAKAAEPAKAAGEARRTEAADR